MQIKINSWRHDKMLTMLALQAKWNKNCKMIIFRRRRIDTVLTLLNLLWFVLYPQLKKRFLKLIQLQMQVSQLGSS